MLSRTAEYALRAVVVLARHYGERPVGVDEIVSVVGAPRNYLSKTLTTLVHRGIITSARGPGGGYSLAVSPDELSVGDVADPFMDTRPHGTRCLLGTQPCDPVHPCPAHRRWTEIRLSANGPLLRTAISALCGASPSTQVRP